MAPETARRGRNSISIAYTARGAYRERTLVLRSAYCAAGRSRWMPPLPFPIEYSNNARASDVPNALPCRANSLIFSGSVKGQRCRQRGCKICLKKRNLPAVAQNELHVNAMGGFGTIAHGLFIDEPYSLIGVMNAPFAASNSARGPYSLAIAVDCRARYGRRRHSLARALMAIGCVARPPPACR